jgi:RND superfamily putative drug exporter
VAAVAALVLATGVLLAAAAPIHRLDVITLAAQPPSIDALHLGLAVGVAIAAVAALGWVACRRPLLGIGSAIAAALPPAAAAGLLVLVFQDGRFQQLLGYRPAGGLFLGALAGATAVVGSACAARWAALLGTVPMMPRVSLQKVRGPMDGPAAALPALLTTLFGAAAGVVLVLSSLLYVKQLGLGVALGLLLDFLLVRLLLAPALLRRAGSGQ